jgi:hypothetical protein
MRTPHLDWCAVWEALVEAECIVNVVDVSPADAKVGLNLGRGQRHAVNHQV